MGYYRTYRGVSSCVPFCMGDQLHSCLVSTVFTVYHYTYILSFPRYLTIDDDALQIHCIVELTRIHVEEIEKIRRIDRDYFRRMIPLIGSYGFGGYYGYWFHLSDWEICKVYATERKQLVLIEDIYEDIYIVSCTDPDRLIELCMEARNRKRKQIRKTLEAAQKSTTQHAVEDQEKQEKEKVPGKQSSAPVSDATTDTSSDTSQKQQAKEETTDHSVKS